MIIKVDIFLYRFYLFVKIFRIEGIGVFFNLVEEKLKFSIVQ